MFLSFAVSKARSRGGITALYTVSVPPTIPCVSSTQQFIIKQFSFKIQYGGASKEETQSRFIQNSPIVIGGTKENSTYAGCIDDLIKKTVNNVNLFTKSSFNTDLSKNRRSTSVDERYEDDFSPERLRIKTQLAKIYNNIDTSIENAESSFDLLSFGTPHDVLKYFVKPEFLNKFIKFYLSSRSDANLIKAKIWYDRFDLFELKRNYGTYYYFLNYYYEHGMYNGINEIAIEMRKNNIPWFSLFKTFFEKKEGYTSSVGDCEKPEILCERSDFDTMLDNEIILLEEKGLCGTNYENEHFDNYTIDKAKEEAGEEAGEKDAEKDEIVSGALLLNNPGSKKNTKIDAIERLESILKSISISNKETPWLKQLYLEAVSHLAVYDRLFKSIKPLGISTYPRDVKDAISNWSAELKKEIKNILSEDISKEDLLESCALHVLYTISKYISIEDIARICISSLVAFIYKIVEKEGVSEHNSDFQLYYLQTAKHIGCSLRDAIKFYNTSSFQNGLSYKIKLAASNLNEKGCFKDAKTRNKMGNLDTMIINTGDLCFNWSDALVFKVGSLILDMIVENLKYTPNLASDGQTDKIDYFKLNYLLRHSYTQKINRNRNFKKKMGFLIVDNAFVSVVLRKPYLSPINLPMLIKPLPWTNLKNGGYISNNKLLMLHPSYQSARALKNSYHEGNMSTILSVIDILSGVPWRVNIDVLEVAEHFLREEPSVLLEGDDESLMGKMSIQKEIIDNDSSNEYIKSQEYRSILCLEKDKYKLGSDKYLSEMEKIKKSQRLSSKRLDCEYKIRLARSLQNIPFYHSFNIDFRGRAYPLSAYLNHTSNDLSRGLLLFAKSKMLGERGLYWLKVQIASHAGCGKSSFEERLKFTENNMDNVIDSACNPINGKRWWLKFDNKWQLLACCIELHKAIQSGDPESYHSGIHIHKDGTCNGIQHYAALGRCEFLAKMVNLTYSDKPNDIYSYILSAVYEKIQKDAEEGNDMASVAINFVERKLIKQTVMTIPYGVTLYGAVQQVNKHIGNKKLDKLISEKFPNITLRETKAYRTNLCRYIANVTFNAIDKNYKNAINIQKWLMMCARTISKSVELENLSIKDLEKTELLRSLGYIPMNESKVDTVKLETISYKKSLFNDINTVKSYENNTPDSYLNINECFLQNPFTKNISDKDNIPVQNNLCVKSIIKSTHNRKKRNESNRYSPNDKVIKDELASSLYCNNAIKWTSPLGLSIVQPYKSSTSPHVNPLLLRTKLQKCSYRPDILSAEAPVSRSQITSFPPNFVHSLDAVHMMLTTLICHEFKIMFASVHDSYWTHPSDVDLLDRAIAHAFVKLHSLDILGNLRSELLHNFRNHYTLQEFVITNNDHCMAIMKLMRKNSHALNHFKQYKTLKIKAFAPIKIDAPPAKGKLDINKILDSKYFFN